MTKLWLTSMSGPGQIEDIKEIVDPILEHLDGIIWVFNDTFITDPGSMYLQGLNKKTKVIHRDWTPRHFHMMNETLFCGDIQEGDLVIWVDPLERPVLQFVSRIKTELDHMMKEAEVGCIYYYGKPFLFRYFETAEYKNSPHWSLSGVPGRAVEWANIEPNEDLVRKNMRPIKRTDKLHWVGHYAKYYLYPAGSNSVALGLDQFPPGDRNQQFVERETRRLEFRRLMRQRGFEVNMDGLKKMFEGSLDEGLKEYLKREKILSDYWHLINGRGHLLKDSHRPADAVPIDEFLP